MWVLQREAFLEIPDDAPVPPDSIVIEVTDEFLDEPEAFEVTPGGLRRRPEHEVAELRAARGTDRLTADEVAAVKKAIEEGRL
jgi:hypothetical protein